MKHAPTLLCSLVLASLSPLSVSASAADSPTAASHHAAKDQRLARLDATAARRPGSAQTEPACLSMLADDPAGAADYAEDWSRQGGADRAARCAALATVALGDPESGARTLDGLSQTTSLPAQRRAMLADEAAKAWLLASEPAPALASAGLALALDPAPEIAIEHGRAALAAHRPALTIADLSPVLAASPDRADALIVRAAALRETGALDAARADIDRACRLQPDEPAALLERGILRERAGDLDGARTDWSRVLAVAPDTHEADLAQQDLALLEAGPEAR
jgi:tetratricopeptide (TPR) repeat protein